MQNSSQFDVEFDDIYFVISDYLEGKADLVFTGCKHIYLDIIEF